MLKTFTNRRRVTLHLSSRKKEMVKHQCLQLRKNPRKIRLQINKKVEMVFRRNIRGSLIKEEKKKQAKQERRFGPRSQLLQPNKKKRKNGGGGGGARDRM